MVMMGIGHTPLHQLLQGYCRARFDLRFTEVVTLAALVAISRTIGAHAWVTSRDLRASEALAGYVAHWSVSQALCVLVRRRYVDAEPIGDRGRLRWRATALGIAAMRGIGSDGRDLLAVAAED